MLDLYRNTWQMGGGGSRSAEIEHGQMARNCRSTEIEQSQMAQNYCGPKLKMAKRILAPTPRRESDDVLVVAVVI